MQTKPLTFADFYTIVWSMVPQVWKEADDEYGKSLQILLYTMSQHMYYYFYNKIVYMDELFDPDLCPEKYLKFLSGMVGWKLIGSDVDSWREQIKAAPLLYKVRGTKRGLMLAEKLIGYSIFMSELYRDHIGDAVPKERIFNNTPEEVKLKPWFRKTLTSVEGELLGGQGESDQFDSFNTTSTVKLDAFGQVIRPRVLSSTRKLTFTNLSTTERYNNITGAFSIARYAKLPRINVVLMYEHDLGEELADGSVKQNNFKGALDLLLQFKPFHVYIAYQSMSLIKPI
jgi:phage tail-like protein